MVGNLSVLAEFVNPRYSQRMEMQDVLPWMTVREIARVCDRSTQAVYKWQRRGKVPADHVPTIRAELRQRAAQAREQQAG